MTSRNPLVTGCERPRRTAAVAALAALCLATGCGSTSFIDDSSAAAAAGDEPSTSITVVEPTEPPPTVAPATLPDLHEVLARERFVPMGVALDRSGLDSVIDGLDEFVLLVPTGSSFASAGTDIGIELSTIMNNPRMLEAIIRYHIVPNPSTNQSWRTLNGATLDVKGSDPATIERVDGVEVLYQIPVDNGSVLVMPRLLLPAHDT
jgi:uncharacterized surface protein with fasciclin (FAS1) repeats